MCGVAIDVPLSGPYLPPGNDETTDTPGARTSGFRAAYFVLGPREEKDAMRSLLFVAPTVIALRAVPGLPIV